MVLYLLCFICAMHYFNAFVIYTNRTLAYDWRILLVWEGINFSEINQLHLNVLTRKNFVFIMFYIKHASTRICAVYTLVSKWSAMFSTLTLHVIRATRQRPVTMSPMQGICKCFNPSKKYCLLLLLFYYVCFCESSINCYIYFFINQYFQI